MPATERYEPDQWTQDGPKITSPDLLAAVKQELEVKGPVLVKHWYYRGARSPDFFVFDDFDNYLEHLQTHSRPGDAFDVWSLSLLLGQLGSLAEGKLPDDDGTVPKKGAY